MYIDECFIYEVENHCGMKINIEDIIENCGIWYTIDEIKKEWEEDKKLDYILSECYWYVEGDEIFVTSPNDIWDDIDEYMKENE